MNFAQINNHLNCIGTNNSVRQWLFRLPSRLYWKAVISITLWTTQTRYHSLFTILLAQIYHCLPFFDNVGFSFEINKVCAFMRSLRIEQLIEIVSFTEWAAGCTHGVYAVGEVRGANDTRGDWRRRRTRETRDATDLNTHCTVKRHNPMINFWGLPPRTFDDHAMR